MRPAAWALVLLTGSASGSSQGVWQAAQNQTVLTIVLAYDDYSGENNGPGGATCDSACWNEQTFATDTESVSAIFLDGSYGSVAFTPIGSQRLVVSMGKSLAGLSSGCPANTEAALALSRSGESAGDYHHVEYWFPLEISLKGCTWAGLANLCVHELGTPPDSD